MKKFLLASFAILALTGPANADITVNVNPNIDKKEYNVRTRYIEDMVKPRMERPEPVTVTIPVTDGKFVIPTPAQGTAEVDIFINDNDAIDLYTYPGDALVVDINNLDPANYNVTGTKLMEDISNLTMASNNLQEQFQKLSSESKPDKAAIEKYNEDLEKVFTDFITTNSDAEASAYALLMLEGQTFMDAYSRLGSKPMNGLFAPLLESQKKIAERNIQYQKRIAELQSGNVEAPDFTFKNVKGEPVSLSDFRGKWVVIDFWGTWCPWCIKGFPALKAAYEELKPKLEILGVACNDKYDKWEAGLVKYALPWVNVYNPEKGGGKVLEDYAVEGFPTKVIVNPEGKISNITVGENPAFFDILRDLVK